MAYKNTSVSVSKSQEAIRTLLINFGARGVQFSEDFDEHEINVRFAKIVNGEMRTVSVSLKVPEPPKSKRLSSGRWYRGTWHPAKSGDWSQMERATYRALHWWLKSQFEFVEFGGLSFEDVFLSHFEWILDNGARTTIGAIVKPRLQSGLQLMPPRNESDPVDAEYS